jgi:hypothetical protein
MTKHRQRERQKRRQAPKAVQARQGRLVFTGEDCFVEFEGLRIAKRGHGGTEHAGTWISLEPGWTVYSSADRSTITIEHNGVRLQ